MPNKSMFHSARWISKWILIDFKSTTNCGRVLSIDDYSAANGASDERPWTTFYRISPIEFVVVFVMFIGAGWWMCVGCRQHLREQWSPRTYVEVFDSKKGHTFFTLFNRNEHRWQTPLFLPTTHTTNIIDTDTRNLSQHPNDRCGTWTSRNQWKITHSHGFELTGMTSRASHEWSVVCISSTMSIAARSCANGVDPITFLPFCAFVFTYFESGVSPFDHRRCVCHQNSRLRVPNRICHHWASRHAKGMLLVRSTRTAT